MSIESEINQIVNNYNHLNLISKLSSKFKKEMTSKFTAIAKIKNISKFSKLPMDIKSDLDIPIPMDVEIRILKDGPNRDGNILISELVDSASRWSDTGIIPFHDMDDMDTITTKNINDDCGSVDTCRIEEIDGHKWAVLNARITNRNIAYQMYLREKKGEPIEVSAEYLWNRDYDLNGDVIQTNIRPKLISLVDKGHIKGNKIEITSQV